MEAEVPTLEWSSNKLCDAALAKVLLRNSASSGMRTRGVRECALCFPFASVFSGPSGPWRARTAFLHSPPLICAISGLGGCLLAPGAGGWTLVPVVAPSAGRRAVTVPRASGRHATAPLRLSGPSERAHARKRVGFCRACRDTTYL